MLTGRIVLRGQISYLEIGLLPNKSRPLIQQVQLVGLRGLRKPRKSRHLAQAELLTPLPDCNHQQATALRSNLSMRSKPIPIGIRGLLRGRLMAVHRVAGFGMIGSSGFHQSQDKDRKHPVQLEQLADRPGYRLAGKGRKRPMQPALSLALQAFRLADKDRKRRYQLARKSTTQERWRWAVWHRAAPRFASMMRCRARHSGQRITAERFVV